MKVVLTKILVFLGAKRFKYGFFSLIMTAAFLSLVVLFNIIAGLLLSDVNTLLDLSPDRIFSIQETTAEFLAAIDDDVELIVTSRENEFTLSGEFYNQTNEILRRFAESNNRITLRYIDLLSNPAFAAEFEGEGLDAATVIVRSGNTGRHRVLGWRDYLNVTFTDRRTGAQITEAEQQMMVSMGARGLVETDVSAGAESAFLSAVMSVTNTNPIHVGITTGYGETRNPHLETLLTMNAYDVRLVDLNLTDLNTVNEGEYPLDMLIIHAPSADYSRETIDMVSEWLANDGQLGRTLFYFAHAIAETPNLDAYFASEWGVAVERSYVIQLDPQFTAPVSFMNMRRDMQYFEPLMFGEDLNPAFRIFGEVVRHTRENFEDGYWAGIHTVIRTTPILSSYPGAVTVPFEDLEDFDFSGSNSSETGAFNIGVKSREERYLEGEFEPSGSNVIVFGGTSIFSSEFMVRGNTNNSDFFMNMLNELTEREGEIPTVTPQAFGATMFEITREQSQTLGVIFAIVLPFLLIITGVVIWIRRIRS
ncbi:MAG: Gldg family protein [Oscillospiraceae bacterium]|nr:Gldg family protein [Oscillospiraceae bacterium]